MCLTPGAPFETLQAMEREERGRRRGRWSAEEGIKVARLLGDKSLIKASTFEGRVQDFYSLLVIINTSYFSWSYYIVEGILVIIRFCFVNKKKHFIILVFSHIKLHSPDSSSKYSDPSL